VTAYRWLLGRACVAVLFVLALGAPSPGHIGGCSTTTPVADPEQYCVDKISRICARTGMACERNTILAMCDGRRWPVGCRPTATETNACLVALVDLSRLSVPDDMLPECQAICGSNAGGTLALESADPNDEDAFVDPTPDEGGI
jgi:hypothetical protein